jgi:hypothetical protein
MLSQGFAMLMARKSAKEREFLAMASDDNNSGAADVANKDGLVEKEKSASRLHKLIQTLDDGQCLWVI